VFLNIKIKMKKVILSFSVFSIMASATAQIGTDTAKQKFVDLRDSASYALGFNVGQTLSQRYASMDKDILIKAINDAYNKKTSAIDVNLTNTIVSGFMAAEQAKAAAEAEKLAKVYLDENKAKPGVITTASGLQYKVIKMGTGAKPKVTDMVKVNYEGRLTDGTFFDGTSRTGQPAQFGVSNLIAGWTEALQLMPVGSKFELTIPAKLGYGSSGSGQLIKPGATLVFDLELLDIVAQTPPPASVAPATKPALNKVPVNKPKVSTPVKRKN
jgi:FKBP-type peptidyl-prolyl cis-trans isomerase FklB